MEWGVLVMLRVLGGPQGSWGYWGSQGFWSRCRVLGGGVLMGGGGSQG